MKRCTRWMTQTKDVPTDPAGHAVLRVDGTMTDRLKEVLGPEHQTIEGVPPLAAGLRELAAALPSLG